MIRGDNQAFFAGGTAIIPLTRIPSRKNLLETAAPEAWDLFAREWARIHANETKIRSVLGFWHVAQAGRLQS